MNRISFLNHGYAFKGLLAVSSADVSRISRSHDQDGHHTHIWGKNPNYFVQ